MNATHTTASYQQAVKVSPANVAEANQPAKAEYRPVTIKAMVDAISDAGAWTKQALEMELATGLALFVENEGVSLATKKMLQDVYVQAGYKAETISSEHYKTVRRRIDASAELYTHIGHDEIVSWIGKAKDRKAIDRIISNLEQYNFTGISSVFALVGKKPVAKPKAMPHNVPAETANKPLQAPQGALNEQPIAAQGGAQKTAPEVSKEGAGETSPSPTAMLVAEGIMAERAARGRRAADAEGSVIIHTAHLSIAIPPGTAKEEIMEMSMKMLEYVNAMQAEKEAVAA